VGVSGAVSDPIVIWGSGAIGGAIGAYLVRAGEDVLFVDQDAAHVEAMNRDGLKIEGPIDAFTVNVKAVTPDQVEGHYSRMMLCVKAHHTEIATRQLMPHLSNDGYVASYQNGLNELVIAKLVGEKRTIGAFLNFGGDYLSPGVVQFSGRGAVVLGELDGAKSERLKALHALMLNFDSNAIMTDHIFGYLWGKLGYGALLFATALTNASICDTLAASEVRPLLRAIGQEATLIALKLGYDPLGFNGYDPKAFTPDAKEAEAHASFDAMVTHNAKSIKTHSGIWRDLAIRKRKTEVDAQLGPIVSEGQKLGIDTPLIRNMIAMIHEIEDGKRALDWGNLAELAGST
jgi:2-dehydropantoate 2-reductase